MAMRLQVPALSESRCMERPPSSLALPDLAAPDAGFRTADLLQQAPALLHQVLETIRDTFFMVDREWRFIYINRHALTEVGQSRDEFLGHTLWEKSPHLLAGAVEAHYRQAMRDRVAVQFEMQGPQSGRWFAVHVYPVLDGLMIFGQDITDRKRNEIESKRAKEQLQENAERLRVLSRRLLEVQELERRHLARELHDEIGQILTGLQYSLETSLRLEGEELRANLADGQQLLKDLTARVRDLSLRLRPTMLDDLGLLPALLWHLERYTAQTKIHVSFVQRGLDRRLHPPEVETAAYRIIQEALTNVARHAGVREVSVRLCRDHDRLKLEVEDEGRGFDTAAVLNDDRSSGLSGMRERAVLLGGHLSVVSTPGIGSRVFADLPVHGMEERRRRGFNSRFG
jgi:PAS domain S-box-containing protein